MTAKGVGVLIICGFLMLLAYQNWNPTPSINLLFFSLPPMPYSFIIFICFLLGFISGWVAHVLKIRKAKEEMSAESAESP